MDKRPTIFWSVSEQLGQSMPKESRSSQRRRNSKFGIAMLPLQPFDKLATFTTDSIVTSQAEIKIG